MKPQTQKQILQLAVTLAVVFFGAIYPATTFGQRSAAPTDSRSTSSRNARQLPFEPSEELIYEAEFSRALIKKVDVADFRFTASRQLASEKITNGRSGGEPNRPAYSLKLTGDVSSKGFFSKLFNLRFREQIESIVEPATFTVTNTKKVDVQGKRSRVSETTYKNGQVVWTERDPNNPANGSREVSAPFAGQVQDIVSAIYFLRTQALEVGKAFELTVSDSGRVYKVPVRVIEKRRMKTAIGRIEAVRVDPEVFGPGRMIASEGRFSIWFTSDNRRVPVSARIKNRYGTFDITLRKVIQNPRTEALASTDLLE